MYNFALEAITQHLDTDSPLPELEDTSSDIADYLNMDTVKVEEIMLFCLSQGLFEQNETTGRLVCNKIYKYLDKASTRSIELRNMIAKYNTLQDCPGQSRTNRDFLDQNRIEENRIDKDKGTKKQVFSIPTTEEVKAYCEERENTVDANRFIDFYSSKGWMIGKNKMKDWKSAIRTWEKNSNQTNQPQQRPSLNPHDELNL